MAAGLLMCLLSWAGPACAAEPEVVSPEEPATFMISQKPGEAMLVLIDALETEFESRVLGPENALLLSSRVPARRMGPVYQYIAPTSKTRQLMLEIFPAQPIDKSRLRMELVRMPSDARDRGLMEEAFRLMSMAAAATPVNDTTTWAMKAWTFKRAASVFARLGWEELRLWSEYFAAHLIFHKLRDEPGALELSREIQAAAGKAGFAEISLAAVQLEGAALLESGAADHGVFERAAGLADQLYFRSEKARAIFADGIAWEREGETERALEKYRQALDVAASAGNTALANEIRGSAAFAYESQGATGGAIEMLEQIGANDAGGNDDARVADSLFEKGRILVNTYRFPEAAAALSEALEMQKMILSGRRWGPTGLALGKAFHGMGSMERAAAMLRNSIAVTSAATHAGELAEAYGALAAIYRSEGDFDRMNANRKAQGALLEPGAEAAHSLDRAIDLAAEFPGFPDRAGSLLSESRRLANAAGDRVVQGRSLLQQCRLTMRLGRACDPSQLEQAAAFLDSAGIPRYALEAELVMARAHRLRGRPDRAYEGMDSVIEAVRFYRSELPGVLGAWYWENRDAIFAAYAEAALRRSRSGSSGDAGGRWILLALEKLRSIEAVDRWVAEPAAGTVAREDADRIRSALARQETQPSVKERSAEARAMLDSARAAFVAATRPMDLNSLEKLIDRLGADEALLSYFFSEDGVWAIVARSGRVRVSRLPSANGAAAALAGVRPGLGGASGADFLARLADLGRMLVAPIAGSLPETVILLPAGPLVGFPFDLLRVDGRFLSERHRFVNAVSLKALEKLPVRVGLDSMEQVFLAGNPEIRRDLFSYDQETSAEIQAVTDRFVGPRLHIVQGAALKRDEFQDGRFDRADLIHLAIPAKVNLQDPSLSKMKLSGTVKRPGSEILTPRDFRGRNLEPGLAVLSGIHVQEQSISVYGGNFDFVSGLLGSGKQAVIVSLWPVPDQLSARFMAAFYGNLASLPDVARALSITRRQILAEGGPRSFNSWAGFQLYVD